jgi:hypothetical protein
MKKTVLAISHLVPLRPSVPTSVHQLTYAFATTPMHAHFLSNLCIASLKLRVRLTPREPGTQGRLGKARAKAEATTPLSLLSPIRRHPPNHRLSFVPETDA